jgi:hypothetical protein
MAQDFYTKAFNLRGSILLIDNLTGCRARVDDYTREEWAQAYHAPSNPYLWPEEKYRRVIPMNFVDGEYRKDCVGFCTNS